MRFHTLPAQSAPFQNRVLNREIPQRTKDSTEKKVERAMGIEPTLVAWEATVLPLNYARNRVVSVGTPDTSRNGAASVLTRLKSPGVPARHHATQRIELR